MAAMSQRTGSGVLAPSRLASLMAHLKRRSWLTIAAYVLFSVTLLTAGVTRGIAGLKPGEVVLGVVIVLLALRRVILRDFSFTMTPIDTGFLLLIGAGTLLPLLTADIRGEYITHEMLNALLGPIEYYLWFRVIVEMVPMPTRLPGMLRVMLVINSIISLVGILQLLRFPGVQTFLVTFYPTYETIESTFVHRATSLVGGWETLAAIAAYTIILINQLQTTEGAVRKLGRHWRPTLWIMLGINVVALLATLSVAGLVAVVIGYLIAWFLNGRLAKSTRLALIFAGIGVLALIPFEIQRFIFQFNRPGTSHSSVPNTWATRWTHWLIVLSVIFVDLPTTVFGVQPSFRYPVLDFGSTESLYLLLLYRGGLLYVLAFGVFIALTMGYLLRVRRSASGFTKQALTAIITILIVNFCIDILDAHFFSAGESQILLTLLAFGAGIGMRTDQQLTNASATALADEQELTRARIPALAPSLRHQRALQVSGLLILVGCVIIAAVGLRYDLGHKAPPTTLQVSTYDGAAPLSQENQNIGSPNWELDAGADTTFIQGYAGKVSAFPGDIVPLYVSSQESTEYNIDVYRVGWYSGLGGRLIASMHGLVSQQQGYWTPQTGMQQCATCTIDPETHLIAANWADAYDLPIGDSWPSGVYLIKLTSVNRAPRAESYIPLIIKALPSAHSTILVDIPVMTYQAFNTWGGFSLYGAGQQVIGDEASPNRATKVSFDRPYDRDAGAGDFLSNDIHTVRYLERSGMDVSYTTSIDIAEYPDQIATHPVYVASGHDEYWTKSMRDGAETALAQGTNLMFLGANDAYWQARLETNALGYPDRTLVCYRVQSAPSANPLDRLAADPAYPLHKNVVTARWRDPVIGRPENTLLGLMYAGAFDATQLGAYTPDWVARQGGRDPLLNITGIAPGEPIHGGLLGDEFDAVGDNGQTPGDLAILSASPVVDDQNQLLVANTAYYRAPSGAYVFDAGTTWWPWALDEYSPRGAAQPNILLGNQEIVGLTMHTFYLMFQASHVPAPTVPGVPKG